MAEKEDRKMVPKYSRNEKSHLEAVELRICARELYTQVNTMMFKFDQGRKGKGRN